MAMKIYVLENGSYSDTHVVGVYSSQANADLAAKHFHDDAHVDEYELDLNVEDMRRDYRFFFVRLHRDTGDVLECYVQESSYGSHDSTVGVDLRRNLHTQCWAADEAHAVKIASERRRQFLAAESENATVGQTPTA